MTTQQRRIAAYGVCRDEAGRVLLVRASARDDLPFYWYLPGGGVEHGETPQQTLRREFTEETGLAVRQARLADVVTDLSYLPRGDLLRHTDRIIFDVIAEGTLRAEVDGTSDRAAWVSRAEASTMTLMPYVSRTLGLDQPPEPPPPPAEAPAPDPARTRFQRFAAYGLTTDPDQRVLLTRISPGYPGAGRWHLPGGGTDFGEQATEGLLREIAEETGQHGRVTQLLDATAFHNPAALGPERRPLDWHTVRTLFRVQVDRPSEPKVLAAEDSTDAANWFGRDELDGLQLNDFARFAIANHLR